MIGSRIRSSYLGRYSVVGQGALGTTITASPDHSRATAANFCSPNYGRVSGQVCCKGLDPGDPLQDGSMPCTIPGYGPVPSNIENVFLVNAGSGKVRIAGGPPLQNLSDPFKLPGDTRPEPKKPTPPKGGGKTAPKTDQAAPPAEGEWFLAKYAGAIMVGVAALAATLILTKPKADGTTAVVAQAPAA